MADAVTSQIIHNGPRNFVARFTNISDGTGESAVTKINAASANGVVIAGNTIYPGTNFKITAVKFAVTGMQVELLWVATSNQQFMVLSGADHWYFKDQGGITVPSGLSGATGSVAFTTLASPAASPVNLKNATYDITIYATKGIPQS